MGWDDKLENKEDEAIGGAKEKVGDATDDQEMKHEGRKDQAKSNVKQAGEKFKEVRDA